MSIVITACNIVGAQDVMECRATYQSYEKRTFSTDSFYPSGSHTITSYRQHGRNLDLAKREALAECRKAGGRNCKLTFSHCYTERETAEKPIKREYSKPNKRTTRCYSTYIDDREFTIEGKGTHPDNLELAKKAARYACRKKGGRNCKEDRSYCK